MMVAVPVRHVSLALLVAVLLAGCGDAGAPTATAPPPRPGAPPPAATRAAEQAAPKLTVAQLAGQRLIACFRGTATPPKALLARIRRGELAGVILFADNAETIAQTRRLADRLQAIPRPQGLRAPLLVLIDQEGGAVRRLRDAPPARSARQLAARGPGGVRAAGRATARGLRRAGVNVDLAPVADLSRPGGDLARDARTFAATSQQAGRLAGAFAAGLRDGGVQATAKHFPGLGAASDNTDDRVVRIGLSAPVLRSRDEPPFAATVRAGAGLVMLANALYPALDARWPASLSPAIVQGELRDRLRFAGVTISDDLEANALRPYGSPGRLARQGVRAGIDLLLYARSYAATEEAAHALERLPRAQLEAGAARVLALRASLRP
jgi:beta-N-acetylhexosaminidase